MTANRVIPDSQNLQTGLLEHQLYTAILDVRTVLHKNKNNGN